MRRAGANRFLLLAFLATFGIIAPNPSHAAYYGSYGYSYGQSSRWGHSNGPIISLELDEKKSRNLDLRIAARDNRPDDVAQLLVDGADVNGKSDEGETALMYAARACSFEAVQTLLRWHPDANVQDVHGRTALIYAVSESCLPVTRLLLKSAHVSLNPQDDMHLSALDYATQGASLEIDGPSVEILSLLKRASKRHFEHKHFHKPSSH